MKRILVTGAKGQLGREIQERKETLPRNEFYFTDIDEMDLTDENEVNKSISGIKPEYIINCAAYTTVDKAEQESEKAYAANATAVKNIINSLRNVPGSKLIHISTDFVFSGKSMSPYTENDRPSAQSVYGKSKQEGEVYALSYEKSIIIRTSWLYSEHGKNFVKTILRLAGDKDEINVVNDQTGSPTWAADLASAIMVILKQSIKDEKRFVNGIYHYSNQGQCSWYEFAREIKKLKGLDLKINPVSSAEFPLPAKRPAYSVLSLDKIKKTFNIEIPAWQDSLAKCLKKIN
ncbi:MAG: dTDP-4-dehydrorhamnose reductase [Bacteroidota bacterium]|nr:dTDP-4-dehydrorhamnose reductase [Bacteroidota bacterium]